ncbi:hypothetical protein FSS13T_15760 [Flavobacterium saliperosum S13]|uniref:Uncharacterized conserved protein n=3 Tax=Flavobacterium saliperosum TaxID=329186 RepID=A0A1G4VGP5_9FLAO|nr:DUF262 domain-containing protein [Flavobacterium saliperosum]ESU25624.1 hypothetical protein FSS13T_15760 [Flavobacterium saliperosum S13]SCX06521.1 Uncharacterized conserved protein [Flavobacterium saliperosum]
MEEPFKPLSLSIKELFGNADSLYKIPVYQRPYKWESEQVEQLWDDIIEAFDNEEENYFLGSIITAKPRDNERSAYVDVVDGQQRLTTLMIMFCVIRDLFPKINEEFDDPHLVGIDEIKASISLHGKSDRLKLYTHAQHNSDFEKYILKGNTLKLNHPYKYQVRIDEEPKYKFINTALIFKEKFEEIGNDKSEKLIDYLFNQVKIIRIDCKNREFAIKLFQVLNDRGMDLTASDLIKSFLLEKLYTKYLHDPDTSKIKENQFILEWREMENTVSNCDINVNDLFIMYEYFLLAQNPKKSLYDELQSEFETKDPNQIIHDVMNFAKSYYKEIWEAEDVITHSLWYIRWSVYWKTILLTAFHTNYKDIEKLKDELRRYYYLYWIAGKTLSQIKQTSFNMIKWIKENKGMDFILAELDKKIDDDEILDLVERNLNSERAAMNAWMKPLLIMLEYCSTDNKKPAFIPLSKDLHLEHILPIKFEMFKEWGHFNKDTASKWINSIGNLTLLCGSKNIECSNNPFSTKISIYTGKGKYQDKDDKITSFQISQNIVNDYNNSTFDKSWNLDAVKARRVWFLQEVSDILNIDIVVSLEIESEPILY